MAPAQHVVRRIGDRLVEAEDAHLVSVSVAAQLSRLEVLALVEMPVVAKKLRPPRTRPQLIHRDHRLTKNPPIDVCVANTNVRRARLLHPCSAITARFLTRSGSAPESESDGSRRDTNRSTG